MLRYLIIMMENYSSTTTETDLVVKEQIDNTTFRLQISSSVASGTLTVVNEEGCRVSEGINLEIGNPILLTAHLTHKYQVTRPRPKCP